MFVTLVQKCKFQDKNDRPFYQVKYNENPKIETFYIRNIVS